LAANDFNWPIAEKSLVNDDTEIAAADEPPDVVVVFVDFDELPHPASAKVTPTATNAIPTRLCERDIPTPLAFRSLAFES
jgi:hypothetical protein